MRQRVPAPADPGIVDHILAVVAGSPGYRVEDVAAVGSLRHGLSAELLREVTLDLLAAGKLELKKDLTLRRR